MDFVAIDFETANFKRSSACSVGITVVKQGAIVSRYCKLIKPYPNYFEPINIGVHQIRPEQVKNSPTFSDLWEEIHPLIAGMPLVAHNAPFDKSVLRQSLEVYDRVCPDFEFYCSHKIAKSLMPDLFNYRLSTVCEVLDIRLNHHEAQSDADGCANIILTLARQHGARSVAELNEIAALRKKGAKLR
ncbi:3'-5' exonuclease [Alistipes sp. ZOR0009]|uniref:3'-5' exonuclease n=1 Tax=Alistipes sp. ZOR0009 TaxID=1339253 RepID=UPI000690E0CF|nr:3'-5' exonuclease [Alistipes sp. ZOR0009]